ncbi:hypothetical protein PLESTB_000689100 [Pleodorina starrii]|uniref:phytol kinase n=1 Tax=Pleodorina starrii TaxID=330485 RepID=A0A9W6BJV4_9CHLO|nr:hypothetical protein PLESTM_001228200 [Pleodorina starrii]GLC52927.1 hypothetical protein PLESTB_000689100 [Pleodorina starrii]GLC65222.1 hypothetical protein PLESTF_000265300 [Pleodorina starrii]
MSRCWRSVAGALERLPAAARLLEIAEGQDAYEPPSGTLVEISKLLANITRYATIEDGAPSLLTAILTRHAVRDALLLITAVASRYRLTFDTDDAHRRNLSAAVFRVVGELCKSHLCPFRRQGSPGTMAFLRFARTLLRMQLFHCASEQLAAASGCLRRALAPIPSAADAPATVSAAAAKAKAVAAIEHSCLLNLSLGLLWQGCRTAISFSSDQDSHHDFDQDSHKGESGPIQVFTAQLGAALRDSRLLEHAAQAVALTALLLDADPGSGDGGQPQPAAGAGATAAGLLPWRTAWEKFRARSFPLLPPLFDTVESLCQDLQPAAAPALREAMSGPCVQHLALSAGIAALHAADGGPTYGLAPALLRQGRTPGNSGQVATADWMALRSMLRALELYDSPDSPLGGWRAAARVALRTADLALKSALEVRAEPKQAGGDGEGRSAPGAAAAAAAAPADEPGDAAADRREGAAGVAGPAAPWLASAPRGPRAADGPRRSTLPLQNADLISDITAKAISCLDSVLGSARGSPGWLGVVKERWRAYWAAVEHVLPLCGVKEVDWLVELFNLEHPTLLVKSYGVLPPAPPPELAAALHAGMLPCLERLLRRAGREPDVPEAHLAARLLSTSRIPLTVLAVYGELIQVASLVVTVDKLVRHLIATLRGADIDELNRDMRPQDAGPLRMLAYLLHVIVVVYGHGFAWLNFADDEGDTAVGELGPQPLRQLRLLLSVAERRWMPTLLRLVFPLGGQQAVASSSPGLQVLLSTIMGSEWFLGVGVAWVHVLLLARHRSRPADARSGVAAAAAAGSAGDVRDSGGGGAATAAHGSPSEDWRAEALSGVDLVAMLAAGLRCTEELPVVSFLPRWIDHPREQQLLQHAQAVCWRVCLAGALCRVALAFPDAVRGAAMIGRSAESALGSPAPAADRSSGGRQRGRHSRGRGSRRAEREAARGGEDGGAGVSDRTPYWPPQLVRSLGSELRSDGSWRPAEAVEGLLGKLELWGEGRVEDAAARPMPPPPPFPEGEAVAAQMAFPGELFGFVRTCANPSCVNLEGDSEAKLPLAACGGCGAVGYCCRGCQVAHWRAGHKAECKGMRG